MLVIVLLLFINSLLPTLSTPRWFTQSTQCRNNIRQLMIGMMDHESTQQAFVAAQVNQLGGKPPYSWRVALLPHIGHQKLYDQYDFDQAWNGGKNIGLLQKMPVVYQCPTNGATAGHTPYKLIADKGTAFEPERTNTFGTITDGSTNTIGIVEDVSNQVPWTKPSDLSVEQAVNVIATQDPQKVAHVAKNGFQTSYVGSNVALMDGATHLIGPTVNPEMIRGMCLCADGNVWEFDQTGDSLTVVHHTQYFVLSVYVILLLLPGLYKLISKTPKPSSPIDHRISG